MLLFQGFAPNPRTTRRKSSCEKEISTRSTTEDTEENHTVFLCVLSVPSGVSTSPFFAFAFALVPATPGWVLSIAVFRFTEIARSM